MVLVIKHFVCHTSSPISWFRFAICGNSLKKTKRWHCAIRPAASLCSSLSVCRPLTPFPNCSPYKCRSVHGSSFADFVHRLPKVTLEKGFALIKVTSISYFYQDVAKILKTKHGQKKCINKIKLTLTKIGAKSNWNEDGRKHEHAMHGVAIDLPDYSELKNTSQIET